jgi:hypothetical protein
VIRPYQDGGTPSTVWYLEQTSRAEPRPAKALDVPVQIVRAELPSPELSRFLYTAVGGDLFWVDRVDTRDSRRLRRTARTTRRPSRTDFLRAAALLHRTGPWPASAHLRLGPRMDHRPAMARPPADHPGLVAHLLPGQPQRLAPLSIPRAAGVPHPDPDRSPARQAYWTLARGLLTVKIAGLNRVGSCCGAMAHHQG